MKTQNITEFRITPFDDKTLDYFKALILRKIGEAEESLADIKQTIESSIDGNSDESPYSAHLGDVASIEYDRAANFIQAQRLRKFIRQLYLALERIENKTYGLCKTTGKPIPAGRLEAVPHTQQSIESKKGLLQMA